MSKKEWEEAEEQFISFFQRKDQYVFQFQDSRKVNKLHGGTSRVFTGTHPSDMIVTDRGVTFYAEVKRSENPTSFPFANVKSSQWVAATRQVAAGGLYFFFLRHDPEGQWYKVPAAIMLLKYDVKKSVRWTDIEQFKWEPK